MVLHACAPRQQAPVKAYIGNERIVQFQMLGFHCKSTAERAGSILEVMDEVLNVNVLPFSQELIVTFDPAKTDVQQLMKNLEGNGFPLIGNPILLK